MEDVILRTVDNLDLTIESMHSTIDNLAEEFKNELRVITTETTNKMAREMMKLREENDNLREIANKVTYTDSDIHKEYLSLINDYKTEIKYQERIIKNLKDENNLLKNNKEKKFKLQMEKFKKMDDAELILNIKNIIEESVLISDKFYNYENLKKECQKLEDKNFELFMQIRQQNQDKLN